MKDQMDYAMEEWEHRKPQKEWTISIHLYEEDLRSMCDNDMDYEVIESRGQLDELVACIEDSLWDNDIWDQAKYWVRELANEILVDENNRINQEIHDRREDA